MTEFPNRSPLFPSKFSADLARSTVAALRASALEEWKSNAERFYDYDKGEAAGEESVDLLQPPVRRVFKDDVGRSPDGTEGPPAAEAMTSAEIEQCFANGEDPWACTDIQVSPRWQIEPRPAAVLAIILMCAMIRDGRTLGRIFRPGGVTLILCPSDRMRSQLVSMIQDILICWKEKVSSVSGHQAAHHVYENASSAVAGDQKRSVQKYRQAIDQSLLRHVSVVAVCSATTQLTSEQESLVVQSLRWPGGFSWRHYRSAAVHAQRYRTGC